ncbi:hypothetical protein BpHYR1_020546 [Brachionus plicatilis]|uniref:Uncharacterized protein n=1 Tax=Brachionus plicatilis TaxID=10195 RepID=A0A3M7S7S9_BRAPC|nr:hypothetical protein BpHYR1_020546 [Brachionus plicatilis]
MKYSRKRFQQLVPLMAQEKQSRQSDLVNQHHHQSTVNNLGLHSLSKQHKASVRSLNKFHLNGMPKRKRRKEKPILIAIGNRSTSLVLLKQLNGN